MARKMRVKISTSVKGAAVGLWGLALTTLLVVGGGAAQAEGDAENGRKLFTRQCTTCHVIRTEEGEVLAGRRARTGPNLYGIDGRVPASSDGYRYGASLRELGLTEMRWDEESFVAYVQSPTDFLREHLDNRRARSRMAYYVRREGEARDIWAFLQEVAKPAPVAAAE